MKERMEYVIGCLYLERRHEEVPDEVELAVNWLGVNCVVLPFLGGVPNHLDRLHTLVLSTTPVQNPDLVEVRYVVEGHRALVRHNHLQANHIQI